MHGDDKCAINTKVYHKKIPTGTEVVRMYLTMMSLGQHCSATEVGFKAGVGGAGL